ncbi:MAG: PQQ-binding-like beta-propeller repeat protein, partial [Alphaproteobacteria bacterium]
LAALVLLASGAARADDRCGAVLSLDVCLGANLACPATTGPVGLAPGSWPVFQQNAQHTGKAPFAGPSCTRVLWKNRMRLGKVQSAMTLAPLAAEQPETLVVPVGKGPVCGLDTRSGAVRWCGTQDPGKKVDRSGPVVGNGGTVYVGTRDNDLWAIVPPASASESAGTTAWRQKVCTDGDVTTPPLIDPAGTVFMGSDSLSAGTLMAMCPGPERQIKWCMNPVGGGIRNMSPALNAAGDRLYVTISSTTLGAFDPATGAEIWRVQLEKTAGAARTPNYSPVVDPTTGRIYLGLFSGLWEVQEKIDPATGKPYGEGRLLFDTWAAGKQRMYSPPAVDAERGQIVFGSSWARTATLRAVDRDGKLLWSRGDLGRAEFRNNPPVIDGSGRIFVAIENNLWALTPAGDTLWRITGGPAYVSSPILSSGRLYAATVDGVVTAVGDCPV